jgi:hypothetical protein
MFIVGLAARRFRRSFWRPRAELCSSPVDVYRFSSPQFHIIAELVDHDRVTELELILDYYY